VKQSDVEYLRSYLAAMGIDPDERQLELLVRHVELVLEANARLNLTRITDLHEALRLHVADSLSALTELQDAPTGAMLDIGSGAGFPGIPLSMCSGRQVVLLDSVGKKAREVQEIIKLLGLDASIEVLAARAEAFARERPAAYTAVTARALSSLPALVELASPLLSVGGRLICLKGTPDESELARGDRAARIVGMRRAGVRTLELPECAGTRTIVVYERVGQPSVRLPRREGMAQRSPLA
jgi:16S rRNA (guanine527-N7)-methyltransferase